MAEFAEFLLMGEGRGVPSKGTLNLRGPDGNTLANLPWEGSIASMSMSVNTPDPTFSYSVEIGIGIRSWVRTGLVLAHGSKKAAFNLSPPFEVPPGGRIRARLVRMGDGFKVSGEYSFDLISVYMSPERRGRVDDMGLSGWNDDPLGLSRVGA